MPDFIGILIGLLYDFDMGLAEGLSAAFSAANSLLAVEERGLLTAVTCADEMIVEVDAMRLDERFIHCYVFICITDSLLPLPTLLHLSRLHGLEFDISSFSIVSHTY